MRLWQYCRQKGQSIVEFAVVLPFLLLIVLGIMYSGFIYSDYEAINDLARMAARDASVMTKESYNTAKNSSDSSAGVVGFSELETQYEAIGLPNNLYILNDVSITYDATNQRVVVTVTARLNPDSSSLSGAFSGFLGEGSVLNNLSVEYQMHCENALTTT